MQAHLPAKNQSRISGNWQGVLSTPPWLKEANAPEDRPIIPDIITESMSTVEVLSRVGSTATVAKIDLEKLAKLAKLIVPNLRPEFLPENMKSVSHIKMWNFFEFINREILIPRGNVFHFYETDSGVSGMSGTIDPRTWRKRAGITQDIWTAHVKLDLSNRPDCNVTSCRIGTDIALLNYEHCLFDAARAYKLFTGAKSLVQIFGYVDKKLRNGDVATSEVYAEICGARYALYREIAQARSLQVISRKVGTLDCNQSLFDHAADLLTTESEIRSLILNESRSLKMKHVVLRYLAHTDGVLAALREDTDAQRVRQGTAAWYDFFLTLHMESRLPREFRADNAALGLFNFQFRKLGFPDLAAVDAFVDKRGTNPTEQAVQLLRRLRALDFKGERALRDEPRG